MNDKIKQIGFIQLSNKIEGYKDLKNDSMPPNGWVYAIRNALGMSMRQLGERLGITAQGVAKLEKNEEKGAITLRTLKEVANALEMQVVYTLIPKEGTLVDIIEKRAEKLAKEIVMRTNNTMILEDQNVEDSVLRENIIDLKKDIVLNKPKYLWDR